MTSIPEDPRVGRQRVLAFYLRAAIAVVFVLAAVAAVAPDSWQREVGRVMVIVLIVAPVGRVIWLLIRWLRRGDWKFASAATVLLLVMGAALVLGR